MLLEAFRKKPHHAASVGLLAAHVPLLGLIPQLFSQCFVDDLEYGMGWKGTRQVEEA